MQIEFLGPTKSILIGKCQGQLCHVLPKGMALDYFEPFLDTPDNKPAWLKDYELFVKELLINFSLYDALMDAKAELDVLIMKDNHKATRFFIDFFWLSMLCDYNDRALLQKVYSPLTKRVKDKMTHFDRLSMLQELRDLVLRINQRYWEHKAEVTHKSGPTPRTDRKFGNKSPKPEPANDASSSKDKKKSKEQAQKKPDLMDKLGKDGKLTPQEQQWRMDGGLCLLCASSSHMIKDCPKAMRGQVAQVTNAIDESSADATDDSTTNSSETKN